MLSSLKSHPGHDHGISSQQYNTKTAVNFNSCQKINVELVPKRNYKWKLVAVDLGGYVEQ